MPLGKLVLNIRDRHARRDLARPYEMHRTLMNGYPYSPVEKRCDLLLRVEPSRTGPPVVIVQTREDPAGWAGLPGGYFLGPAESNPLDLLDSFTTRNFHLRHVKTESIELTTELIQEDRHVPLSVDS